MTDERWRILMNDDDADLTPAEIADGWHFCPEFDGLLIGPDMPEEMSLCTCVKPGAIPADPQTEDGNAGSG